MYTKYNYTYMSTIFILNKKNTYMNTILSTILSTIFSTIFI